MKESYTIFLKNEDQQSEKILEVKNLKKIYKTDKIKTEALKDINFTVEKGEFISIMGESGSGKTTLLNMISTLDSPTEGIIKINQKNIGNLKKSEIASFRRNCLGFVFQELNLLEHFSNRDNIYLPLVLSNIAENEMKERLEKIQDILKIKEFLDKYPYEISGGQKQRIAIARAIITNPSLLLADEPTGSLDSSSSKNILELFESINKLGQTIVMVTHSVMCASHSNRVLFIKDGIVYHEIYRGQNTSDEFAKRIVESQIMLSQKEA